MSSEPEPAGQFGHPTGWVGRLAGRMMARRNVEANRWAVELVGVAAGERILEIGFGPGVGVALLAERGATVEGVDASATMVRQAVRHNLAAIQSGKVELREGSAAQLPYDDGHFDAVVSVFSLHHWPDVGAALAEAHRVLVAGGRLVVVDRTHDPDARPFHPAAHGLTDDRLAEATAAAGDTGFVDVEVQHRRIGSDPVMALSARLGGVRDSSHNGSGGRTTRRPAWALPRR